MGAGQMIRSVLYFSILPGRTQDFVDEFRRLEVLQIASAQPGFLRSQLHVPLEGDGMAMVTADWETAEGYQGWLDNPVRETIGASLDPFLDEDGEGRLFEVVYDVAKEDA
jgi:heme-degrading monooxygenase HmoA